jgi:DNA mismatch repair ATPase MutL
MQQDFSEVEVKDNGSGINAVSRQIVGCAHATSKIACFEDIYEDKPTAVLGFRGEALHLLSSPLSPF